MFTNAGPILPNKNIEGNIQCQAPSNIALVKYWGKYATQYPRNPSLSMTLKKCSTNINLSYKTKKKTKRNIEFYFDGSSNPFFADKVKKHLQKVDHFFPFLKELDLIIRSENTFPHSAGIASSASSSSALSMAYCYLENKIFKTLQDKELFLKKASYTARLGSGSACRSVYGGFVAWGDSHLQDVSNDYATQVKSSLGENFKSLRDAILIIDQTPKKISSREGHELMNTHPFANARYEMARSNFKNILEVMLANDFEKFAEIVELEALTLHALMMSSTPSYTLLRPNTLKIIELIKNKREKEGWPVTFTLDAGPNIHLLYPSDYQSKVHEFINQELISYLDKERWIDDCIGPGPILIS